MTRIPLGDAHPGAAAQQRLHHIATDETAAAEDRKQLVLHAPRAFFSSLS